MAEWQNEIWEKLTRKYSYACDQAKRQDIIPYIGRGSQWEGPPYAGDFWWTNGFWPALMWQMFDATGEEKYRVEARRVTSRVEKMLYDFTETSHDMGFLFLLSTGADWKLTHDENAKRLTLMAANFLAGRYNPNGFIRAWNGEGREGWAIVDCMMNLPLLHWASAQTGDPRFDMIARIHADTTEKYFVRPDGSCNHIVIFDAKSGEMLDAPGGQGAYAGSSWSRGQAWALYGFTLSYLNTKEARYLDVAKRIANYFIANIRPDGLTDCDFRQPKEPEKLDNIAGACAACGLIELARVVPEGEQALYMDAALRLLHGMAESSADWDETHTGLLTRCTAAYHNDGAGQHINIVYGDYFFVEAIRKLKNADPMLWGVK